VSAVPEQVLELRGWTREAVERLGLGWDGKRVTIPVRDASGELLGHLRYSPNGADRKMLAAKDTTRELFPLPEDLDNEELNGQALWLVEGEPDCIAVWSVGLPAVAVPGAGKWQDEWAARFAGRRWRVVVCFDCDAAGRKSAARAAQALVSAGVDASVLDLDPDCDDGYDLSDLLKEAHTATDRAAARRLLTDLAARARPADGGLGSVTLSRERVYSVVGECFPAVLDETIAGLSVAATVLLGDQQNPVAVNYEGPPSSLKTTVIDFFAQAEGKVYRSDRFTPKSFVSHAAQVSREKLNEIDLLPRIRHKLLLIPELAPLFGLRNEDLLENFSILTRVLDGQGLTTDSGVHGRRGHTGDYLFAWLGCTTPIEHRVWKTMGKLGSRLLFLEMRDSDPSDEELVAGVTSGVAYRQRVERCAQAVADLLADLWRETGGVRGVTWDRSADPPEVMKRIAGYARTLARLRGTISVWREGSGEEETYNFSTPVIEQPHRAMSLLYALARGHALVHGRRQVSEEDLALVARAALESAPNDRRAVMRALLRNQGTATASDVERELRCSAPTARAILETMDKLGVGDYWNPGPPVPATLELAEPLRWLLADPVIQGLREGRTAPPKAAERSDR
jgi:hypothetical protein